MLLVLDEYKQIDCLDAEVDPKVHFITSFFLIVKVLQDVLFILFFYNIQNSLSYFHHLAVRTSSSINYLALFQTGHSLL